MLRHFIQTAVWKYDKYIASIVALLPASAHRASVILGRMTLPSIWAALLAAVSLLNIESGNTQWAMLGFMTVVAIPVGSILKFTIRRQRPKTIYAQNMKIKSYSFPSSHTYSATVAGGYFALFFLHTLTSPLSLIAATFCVAFVGAIGISRIYVGAHYPTDVTAGWLLGIGILYALTTIHAYL
jgi:undecaprenyl-diphosphatase